MRLATFFLLNLALVMGAAAQGPTTLSGRVIDGRTGEGLAGASVFLAGTQTGTVADAEGRFTLATTLTGRFDLVASLLGYATATEKVRIAPGETLQLQVALAAQEARLPGLTVEDDGRAWRRNLARFTRVFIGEVPNAAHVRLLNPDVLRFELVGEGLQAWAEAPLEIENRALGYHVTYLLDRFASGPQDREMQWDGRALFEELPSENAREARRWREARRKAFQGSFRHFLRMFARGEANAEGYRIARSDSFSTYGWQSIPEEKEGLFVSPGATPGTYNLAFTGVLHVTYTREEVERMSVEYRQHVSGQAMARRSGGVFSEPPPVQRSMLRLLQSRTALSGYGLLFDPNTAVKYGYWAWEDRIANLLPYEYGMED